MRIFTVHLPATDFDRPGLPDRTVFVREAFSWPAFFLAPIWLPFHRCWLAFVGWLVAVGAIFAIAWTFDVSAIALFFALLAFQALVGLEAQQFRRWSLARRGFRPAGVAAGKNVEEAAISFAMGRPAATTQAWPIVRAAPARPVTAGDGLGLTPLGGGI